MFPAFWRDKLAIDKKFVAFFDLDVAVSFRRGRIRPFVTEAEVTLAARKRQTLGSFAVLAQND